MTHWSLAIIGLSGGEVLLISIALFLAGVFVVGLAAIAFLVIRSLNKKPVPPPPSSAAPPAFQPRPPEPMVDSGKQVSQTANLVGTQFADVNLSGAAFENVNLSNARFHNVNLSNVVISAAQMGGAAFKHIGPPPDQEGKQERQRPVRFEEMMLCDSTFRKVDLSNVRVVDCDLTGMTVNGILLTELITAYERQQAAH